jgi:hypothetical protein
LSREVLARLASFMANAMSSSSTRVLPRARKTTSRPSTTPPARSGSSIIEWTPSFIAALILGSPG